MADKHDLGNMIFNLENKKDLKTVTFTRKAVIEVLGYLKELQCLELKLDKAKQDILDKDNTIANLSYKVSKEAQNSLDNFKRIIELEKALELACEKLPMEYEYCSSHPERYNLQDEYGSDEPYWIEEGGCEFDSPERCLECVINYFETKAKEMMKSE